MNGPLERWATRNPDVRFPLLLAAVLVLWGVGGAIAPAQALWDEPTLQPAAGRNAPRSPAPPAVDIGESRSTIPLGPPPAENTATLTTSRAIAAAS